jgi:hypothetical protein
VVLPSFLLILASSLELNFIIIYFAKQTTYLFQSLGINTTVQNIGN